MTTTTTTTCPQCGNAIASTAHGRRATFCSSACRARAWRQAHGTAKPAVVTCRRCGEPFNDVGRGRQRLFCGLRCKWRHDRGVRIRRRVAARLAAENP